MPDDAAAPHGDVVKGPSNGASGDEPAAYQVVGEVTAHQADDG